MAPGRSISMRYAARHSEAHSEDVEDASDAPRRRGKAAGLAVKNHKAMNNNKKPRVEFKRGLLKPIGPWAKEFASEVGRILRMNAPLAIRNWKRATYDDKDFLHKQNFDVDLHVPHVRRAVNRYLGQRLRDFRCKLYQHYKEIPEGLDKREYPHEGVFQPNGIGMCDWFESEDFKKMSVKNKSSRGMQKDNHCCGRKPFVRIREELTDQHTQEEPGRISMYHHTHFSKKKGRWVSDAAEENYNMMNVLQSAPPPANSTLLTEDQIYDKVLGKRPGYVHGLGHRQDPLPAYALDELDNVEAARRNAQEAERRAEEAERRAEEAQRRFEESERRQAESERQIDEKLQAMRAEMLNFMAQVRNPSMMDLLMMGGMGSMGGNGGMGGSGGMVGMGCIVGMGGSGGMVGMGGSGGMIGMGGSGGMVSMGGIGGMGGSRSMGNMESIGGTEGI